VVFPRAIRGLATRYRVTNANGGLCMRIAMSFVTTAAAALVLISCSVERPTSSSAASVPETPQLMDELYRACSRGEADKVLSQLRLRPTLANAATSETRDTPLMRAAEFSRSTIVEILLSHGANPNAADINGRTALITASYVGDSATVSKLLAAGSNPNSADTPYGFTPLLNATLKGHTEVVRLLLVAGADPSIRAKDGRSALDIAEQHGAVDIATLIRASVSGTRTSTSSTTK